MTPTLTIESLRATETDDALFQLLCAELGRRLPHGRKADDHFASQIREAWKIWHESERGLFAHWIAYARQFPEGLI